MTYTELQQFSKAIDNSISYEDFYEAGINLHRYNADYINTIWQRWCKNPIYFMASHKMGETIFNMLQNKINADKLINP